MAFPVADAYKVPSGGVLAGGRFRFPAWVPAPNTVATLTESNTFQSVNPGRSGANGWSFNSSGVSIGGDSYIFAGTIDAFSGGVYNPYYGAKGSLIFNGGGHSVSNWGGIVALDIATQTYSVVLGGSGNCYPISGSNGEYADGSLVSTHTYDMLTIIGPESGYALGALVVPVISGGTHEANATTTASHLFDFAHPENGWVRLTENATWITLASGPCAAYDPDLNRVWWVIPGNNNTHQHSLDLTNNALISTIITNRISPSASDSLSIRYDRERHLLIHANATADQSSRRVFYLDTTNVSDGWRQATLSAPFPVPTSGLGFSFDKIPDGTYLCNAQGRIFRLTVPAVLTDTWQVSEIIYAGAALGTAYVHGKRWSYVPALESFVWKSSSSAATQIYRV